MDLSLKKIRDADGTLVGFVDHADLHDPRRTAELIREAERRLEASAETPTDDGMSLFKALHACGYALSRARRGGNRAVRLTRLRARLLEFLFHRNLGLVYDMRKRSRVMGVDADDLLSEGFWSLYQAVGRFDPWRGFRFSTYACTSILRGFIMLGKRKQRQQDQLSRRRDDLLRLDHPAPPIINLDTHLLMERVSRSLAENEAGLTPTERFVIERRLLHPPAERADTLESIGKLFRLSKERVRQIQVSAIDKLRTALNDPAATEPESTGFDVENEETKPGEENALWRNAALGRDGDAPSSHLPGWPTSSEVGDSIPGRSRIQNHYLPSEFHSTPPPQKRWATRSARKRSRQGQAVGGRKG